MKELKVGDRVRIISKEQYCKHLKISTRLHSIYSELIEPKENFFGKTCTIKEIIVSEFNTINYLLVEDNSSEIWTEWMFIKEYPTKIKFNKDEI